MKALHNRMEWKWFICFVCAAVIVSSFAFAGRAAAASSDVKGHWAEQLLAGWRDQGLLKGYPDGSMKPDRALTRIELMAMINRHFHLTAEKAASFPDLKSGQWQYAEAAKALEAGYVSGYADGSVRPDQLITREEAAVMLFKVLKAEADSDPGVLKAFKDAGNIADWSRQALAYLVLKGKLGGYPDGTLRPQSALTRAEGAVLISRLQVSVPKTLQSYGKSRHLRSRIGNRNGWRGCRRIRLRHHPAKYGHPREPYPRKGRPVPAP